MVFTVREVASEHSYYLEFQGRMAFKLDMKRRCLSMFDLSQKELIDLYWFPRWNIFRSWQLHQFTKSFAYYHGVVRRVKMHNYRALFGKQLEEIIGDLAKLMSAAEAEAIELAKFDSTHGGSTYHPEIRRMLQLGVDDEE